MKVLIYDNMTATKINVDQIGHCRQGSDIDLEAIFQGHISGRRPQGVKVNPVYQDSNHSDVNIKSDSDGGKHELECTIDIQVYKNIPTAKINQNNGSHLIYDEHSDANITANQQNNQDDDESLNDKWQEMQRDSLKVTNGNVCVGDIIIENGYRNPSYTDEDAGALNEVVKELKESDPKDETQSNENEGLDQSTGKHQKVKRLKEEIDSLRHSGRAHHQDNGGVYVVTKEVVHVQQNGTAGRHDTGKSDWPNIDDIVVQSENDKSHSDGRMKNGNAGVSDQSVSGENLRVDCDVNHNQGKLSKSEKSKSERKSSKKKLKERKNSLPDHILNSLSMKPAKPILIPTTSFYDSTVSNGDSRKLSNSISEQKSVKFSDDTVFNEHKPNKYKKERLNLRDIYRGKISNDHALAKANPLFVDDDGFEISLTDDEKVSRYSTSSQLSNDLNLPAYFKEYIINSGDLPPVTDSKESLSRAHLKNHDIESISSDLGGNANYDRLISKTLAKERRSKIIRLTLASFAFLIVVGVVVLLVIYFGRPHKQS